MSGLLPYAEALAAILGHATSPRAETVPLTAAPGRRLAAPVTAAIARPSAAVSAMDGYAVRLADVSAVGAQLSVIGEAPAGTPFQGAVNAGEAVRIFTGGELPDGADHIVIQEHVARDGDVITCVHAYTEADFIRPRAMDFDDGETVLEAGTVLGPAELSLAAAANLATLQVYRRPRVGLLANGDELRPPGSDVRPGEVVNSNPVSLGALIESWGGDAFDLGIAADSVADIQSRIAGDDEIDIFLPVGGASVGDHDHMRPAFAGAGFEPIFARIGVRPGKPTWFSRREAQFVLGLPGNPASAYVCAHLFLKPLLTGQLNRIVQAQTATPLKPNGPRMHFMRARAAIDESGVLTVTQAANQDSSLIRPLAASNALIQRDPDAPAAETGTPVPILPVGPLA